MRFVTVIPVLTLSSLQMGCAPAALPSLREPEVVRVPGRMNNDLAAKLQECTLAQRRVINDFNQLQAVNEKCEIDKKQCVLARDDFKEQLDNLEKTRNLESSQCSAKISALSKARATDTDTHNREVAKLKKEHAADVEDLKDKIKVLEAKPTIVSDPLKKLGYSSSSSLGSASDKEKMLLTNQMKLLAANLLSKSMTMFEPKQTSVMGSTGSTVLDDIKGDTCDYTLTYNKVTETFTIVVKIGQEIDKANIIKTAYVMEFTLKSPVSTGWFVNSPIERVVKGITTSAERFPIDGIAGRSHEMILARVLVDNKLFGDSEVASALDKIEVAPSPAYQLFRFTLERYQSFPASGVSLLSSGASSVDFRSVSLRI